MGALVLEIYGEPYCDARVAALARMSICTLLLSLSIASLLMYDLPAWAEVLVLVCLLISMVVPVYIFLYNLFQQGLVKVISWAMVCPADWRHRVLSVEQGPGMYQKGRAP